MKRLIAYLFAGLFCAGAVASEAGVDEIKALGQLNGKALACAQKENLSRIKMVMINLAPKTRQHGVAFEESTHEAFITRSKESEEACADAALNALQVESLAERLQALFPARAQ